jgi:hypothetical protein
MSLSTLPTKKPNLFSYENKSLGGFPPIRDVKISLLGDRKCDRPGFSSFLVTFFFSFHKEKKKVTERFEIKEKFNLKIIKITI